jgi:DMSO reductase family type II enzyme chaperone
MMTPKQRNERAQDMLRRGALFKWLAHGFAYPSPGHSEGLAQAFRDLGKAPRQNFPRLARHMKATLHWQTGMAEADLMAEYMRLFLGSGPVSLHETAYGDGRRIVGRPVELADISGFYLAFGFALSEDEPDLPDHLCTELEFYSLLLVKEAYALARGWLPQAHIARAAAKAFLEQHLGRWIGALKSSLQENRAAPYLDLADVIEAIVEAECKRLHVQPIPFTERLPHDVMQDESLVCPQNTAMTAA